MMDTTYIVMAFIFGIYIGASLERWASHVMRTAAQQDDKQETDKRGIYVEEHQNKLFAYDIKTHKFLCSFADYKELHKNLTGIDSTSTWVFYEDSRVIIESYMRRHRATNESI